jgi:hypothetical protein
MASATAGYSGTPLPKKLGIRERYVVALDRPPSDFAATLGELPENVRLVSSSRGRDFDVILFFVRDRNSLESRLAPLIEKMAPATALWICWPKKTSRLAKDVSETHVRAMGLDAGLVDVKICAVDQDWSGLKFVFRVADRPAVAASRPARKKKK